MESFKRRWKNIPLGVRKPVVLIIGNIIVIGGIILLPLPGPGWVIIFAGFALLATEFAFAEKVQDRLLQVFKLSAYYLRKTWNDMRGRPTSDPAPMLNSATQRKSKH